VALLLLLHFVLAHYRKGRHSRCGALWDGPRLSSLSLLRPVCKFCVCVCVCLLVFCDVITHSTWPEKLASVHPVCVFCFVWCTWRASMTLVLWRLHFGRIGFTHTHSLKN
jgi:hypothetical protein